jgi:hypothetical protein
MDDVHISKVDAIRAQLWMGTRAWRNHGNQAMWSNVEQKRHKIIAGLEYEVGRCYYGNQGI